MSRKIAFVTGTRAEYGLLYWTMKEVQAQGATLQLIATGAHLSKAHGYTISQIEADGFTIDVKVDMQLAGDSRVEITQAMGRAVSGMASALTQLKPDIVVLLGDRYEILAAASAAAMLNIPIAHIHGGEITEGAIDEAMRHAISKLSYWHFASAAPYAKRLIQMGEDPSRVFTVGAPGIDNIARLELLDRPALEKELGLALTSPLLLVTYHPETMSRMPVDAQCAALTRALDAFPNATLIMSGSNADAGGLAVNAALETFAKAKPQRLWRISYGSRNYLSLMKEANVVIGNSSSGVIETPALGRATVNIGDRQKGRLRAPSVIDCPCDTQAIIQAIKHALASEFHASLETSSLFGVPGKVAPAIAKHLLSVFVPVSPIKPFHDLASSNSG